jgi:hypothetical protein
MGHSPLAPNQTRPPTRMEILRRDYFEDRCSLGTFEDAVEFMLRLGVEDDACPFSPERGWGWWYGIDFPRTSV